MQVFEKLAEYRYEQLVFCHDKATGLTGHNRDPRHHAGACARRLPDVALRHGGRGRHGRPPAGPRHDLQGRRERPQPRRREVRHHRRPPRDKSEALFRSFGRYIETLGGRYIVAEDVGTSTEDMDHIQVETSYVVGVDVSYGGSGDPSPFTALGVLQGMRACVEEVFGTTSLEGRTVAVQGLGHVGLASVPSYSTKKGPRLIVTDLDEEVVERARRSSAPRRWSRMRSSPCPATSSPLAPWGPS